MTTGLEYEVLAILNDNFDTLSLEQQDHVMAMFAARNKYTVTKTKTSTSKDSFRPNSKYKHTVKPS